MKTLTDSRGFTLTELLIVVTVVAILTSVALPTMMSVKDRAKSFALNKAAMAAEHDIGEIDRDDRPMLQRYELDMALAADYQRVGLHVFNRFKLDCEGELEFRAANDGQGQVQLAIPFPEGTFEAWDIHLEIAQPDGSFRVPDDVAYHQSGIVWKTAANAGEPTLARVRFSALGRDRLKFVMPPARRLEQLHLKLDLSETPANQVADYSLTPTAADGDVVEWRFENLVTSRQIVVDVPGAESPAGRLLQLFRFMAVAVLLFGGGFLYMNERDAPGRLDRFRLGHFSLLAATYSLFFIVFAVIIYHEQLAVAPALGISIVSSLPLLVFHVSKITNLDFALKHVLPLAVLTLAVVMNGVYGGAIRDYVFLLILIVSVAYLTLTYRPKLNDETTGMPMPKPA